MNVRLIIASFALCFAPALAWGQMNDPTNDSEANKPGADASQSSSPASPPSPAGNAAPSGDSATPAPREDPVEELMQKIDERFDKLYTDLTAMMQQAVQDRATVKEVKALDERVTAHETQRVADHAALKKELVEQITTAVAAHATLEQVQAAEKSLAAYIDQAAAAAATSRQQLEAKLTQQIQDAGAGKASAQDLDQARTDMSKLRADVDTLTNLVRDVQNDIGALRTTLSTTADTLRSNNAELGQLLQAVTSRDGSNQPTIALRSIMEKSPEFKQEVADAIHSSLRQTGRLVIQNKMTIPQTVTINNSARYPVEPGQTRIVEGVPVGTVTTQLDGGSQKSWSLVPPNYEQGIEIVPARAPTVPISANGSPLAVQ